jgi:predicted amidohydrolase
MRLALIQQHATSNKSENIKRGIKSFIKAAENGAQLIAFAELAFDPFYPQYHAKGDVKRFAETVPGPTTEIFSGLAKEYGVVTVLNIFERDGENTYDASPVYDSDGSYLGKTRMVHIPDYEYFHERDYYKPGNLGTPVFKTAIGKVGIAICYDRHFPEYMRALAMEGAELVVIPQAGATGEWTTGLYEAEMQVSAFQNGYYTALCNRVGKEDNLNFSGESFVCSPSGKIRASAKTGVDDILYCDIDLSAVRNSHAKRLFLPDRRPGLYGDWSR